METPILQLSTFLTGDNQGRAERVDVLDASSNAVLDSRTISGFQGGQYLVWNLKGHVTFRITLIAGPNAVLSGLFFGSPAVVATTPGAATFVKTDETSQGTWKGAYGSDGEAIFGDSISYPAYSQVSFSGASAALWAASTTDVRGLQKAAATDRIAPVWYTSSAMDIDVNLTDGNMHSVALYFLDWDDLGRAERVDVLDALGNAVLDTRTISAFQGGQYLVWNLTGHVVLRITLTGGPNAVFSGLFFSPQATAPPAAAMFMAADTTTQGTCLC